MTTPTLKCKSPTCEHRFPLDVQHRFGGFCSADCQRGMTPRTNQQRTVHGELDVLVDRAPITRKLGKQNWKRSDE